MFTKKLAIVAFTLSMLPATVLAQTSSKSSPISAYARAIELHDQAVALYSQPDRAWDAARLHVAEAKLRSATDPEAVEALAMAAHLFNYASRPMEARKTMEQAGDRALAIGNVARAAQAFLQAAFIADKAANVSETQRLGQKALLLTQSPVVTPSQRQAIRERIRTNGTLAILVD